MTAVARVRGRTAWLRGKRLLLLGLLAVGVFFAAFPLIMAWPHAKASRTTFRLGSVDQYAITSVTTVPGGKFHLVRLSEHEFVALSWRNPGYLRCTVPWRPTFVWPDADGNVTSGWFRDPCSGSTFDRAGHKVFGPALRDMDRYPVSIIQGHVIVDTNMYVCPFSPPDAGCLLGQ